MRMGLLWYLDRAFLLQPKFYAGQDSGVAYPEEQGRNRIGLW